LINFISVIGVLRYSGSNAFKHENKADETIEQNTARSDKWTP